MKKFFPPLFAGLLLLAPAAVSASSFEGKITSTMTTPNSKKDGTMLMTTSRKDDYYRVDIDVEPPPDKPNAAKGVMSGMIMDMKDQKMIILMPQMKKYMVRDMPKPEAHETDAKEITSNNDVTVNRTGKKEKILGYTCEQIVMTMKDKSTVELWGTDQLGAYMSSSAPSGGGGGMFGRKAQTNATAQAWEKALSGKDFFPLRTVLTDSKGVEAMRMEATNIEKKKLSDADFAPPSDYEKFDMGSMMKGMIPGFGK